MWSGTLFSVWELFSFTLHLFFCVRTFQCYVTFVFMCGDSSVLCYICFSVWGLFSVMSHLFSYVGTVRCYVTFVFLCGDCSMLCHICFSLWGLFSVMLHLNPLVPRVAHDKLFARCWVQNVTKHHTNGE
jgi:hypothetical protein